MTAKRGPPAGATCPRPCAVVPTGVARRGCQHPPRVGRSPLGVVCASTAVTQRGRGRASHDTAVVWSARGGWRAPVRVWPVVRAGGRCGPWTRRGRGRRAGHVAGSAPGGGHNHEGPGGWACRPTQGLAAGVSRPQSGRGRPEQRTGADRPQRQLLPTRASVGGGGGSPRALGFLRSKGKLT
jgi:hypothetical protein